MTTPAESPPHAGRAIRVGLLDSGVDAENAHLLHARRRFALEPSGATVESPALDNPNGHGSAIGRIIAALAPTVQLLDAQVFDARGAASPAAVASALRWLTDQGARLVNMSFGLIEDREILRQACAQVRDAGVVMLASAPARGPRVFPASYPGVISVSADGRCAGREVSFLGGEPADFGACPTAPEGHHRSRLTGGGSSYAVARITGISAAWMVAQSVAVGSEDLYRHLASIARHISRRALHAHLNRHLP